MPTAASIRQAFPVMLPLFRANPNFARLQELSTDQLIDLHRKTKTDSDSKILDKHKAAHQKALAKKAVKWLNKTGWGYWGPIKYFFTLPAEVSLEGLSLGYDATTDDSDASMPSLDKLPKETIIQIFGLLGPNEEEGCLALALTCKRLASIAANSKALKTDANLQSLGWSSTDKKWCPGCGKNRKLTTSYWKEVEQDLKADWDVEGLDLEKKVWSEAFEVMIAKWQQDANTVETNLIPEACWCPACSAQMRWEQKEGAKEVITDAVPIAHVMVNMFAEILLGERGVQL